MGFGLFGKLPSKRDFVALDIPRSVLEPFENWLQSAVAASRNQLGDSWEDYYMVSPIWRFWIGPDVFGSGCTGALMPSVDKVGRYFPLSIVYSAGVGEELIPPPFDPLEDWYGSLEKRLLAALSDDAEIAVEDMVAGLAPPAFVEDGDRPEGLDFRGGASWTGNASMEELLTGIREDDYWRAAAQRSYWWTGGIQDGPSIVHVRAGLPDPFYYTQMIRGQLES